MPDLVLGKDILVVSSRRHTVFGVGHILASQDGEYARKGLGSGCVNALDEAVRNGGAK